MAVVKLAAVVPVPRAEKGIRVSNEGEDRGKHKKISYTCYKHHDAVSYYPAIIQRPVICVGSLDHTVEHDHPILLAGGFLIFQPSEPVLRSLCSC